MYKKESQHCSTKKRRTRRRLGLYFSLFLSISAHFLAIGALFFYLSYKNTSKASLAPLKVSMVQFDQKPFQIVDLPDTQDDMKNTRSLKSDKLAEMDSSTDKEQVSIKNFKKKPAMKKLASSDKSPSFANDPLGIKQNIPKVDLRDYDSLSDALDVQMGEKTELNTWRWKHAPFFNRMKSLVREKWSPGDRIREHDPEGLQIGLSDRVTILKVSINSNGDLVGLKVIENSGLDYLDEEAQRAFRRAAPFLYPPKELFNEQGEFSFQFAFFLQVNRSRFLDFYL